MIEQEALKKKEMLAVCEMCETAVPDAKSCYCNPVDFTFLCLNCFTHIPTVEEAESLILKIRENQKMWTAKKDKYKEFLSLQPENGKPIPPTSVEEVELHEVEELRV